MQIASSFSYLAGAWCLVRYGRQQMMRGRKKVECWSRGKKNKLKKSTTKESQIESWTNCFDCEYLHFGVTKDSGEVDESPGWVWASSVEIVSSGVCRIIGEFGRDRVMKSLFSLVAMDHNGERNGAGVIKWDMIYLLFGRLVEQKCSSNDHRWNSHCVSFSITVSTNNRLLCPHFTSICLSRLST